MGDWSNDTYSSFSHEDYDFYSNFIENVTNTTQLEMQKDDVVVTVVVGVLLGLIILVTVVGNMAVLAAIYMEKNLHSLQNYLIFSLAVADLFVACLVMPLGAVYEISKSWWLGVWLCITWTSSDVLSCTASILHLAAIALDRYLSIIYVDYSVHNRRKGVECMIAAVWILAFLIALSQVMYTDMAYWEHSNEEKLCSVNQDVYFQIFATSCSFWVPLLVILLLYWKIFEAARKRIRKRRTPPATSLLPRPPGAETSLITQSSSNPSPEKATLINNYGGVRDGGSDDGTPSRSVPGSSETVRKGTPHHQLLLPGSPANSNTPEATPAKRVKTPREAGESKREKKAAKTLAIITGVFIGCWLPFFVFVLVMAICGLSCRNSITEMLGSLTLWLGYFNSTLNPIIYTIFSPEFRLAFKKILGLSKRKPNRPVAV